MKVMIMPGAMDDLTEEEQKEIMEAITKAIADGSFFTESEAVDFDQLKAEDPQIYEQLMESIESMPTEGEVVFEMMIKDPIDQAMEDKVGIFSDVSKTLH